MYRHCANLMYHKFRRHRQCASCLPIIPVNVNMPQGWSAQTHTSEALSCHSLQREHLQSRSDRKGLHDVQTVMNQLINGAGGGGGGGGDHGWTMAWGFQRVYRQAQMKQRTSINWSLNSGPPDVTSMSTLLQNYSSSKPQLLPQANSKLPLTPPPPPNPQTTDTVYSDISISNSTLELCYHMCSMEEDPIWTWVCAEGADGTGGTSLITLSDLSNQSSVQHQLKTF